MSDFWVSMQCFFLKKNLVRKSENPLLSSRIACLILQHQNSFSLCAYSFSHVYIYVVCPGHLTLIYGEIKYLSS